MIASLISYFIVLLLYWMFQAKLRVLLWSDLPSPVQQPLPLVLNTIKTQLMTMSPTNIFFQAHLDLELGLKTQRESMLLLCMSRLSLLLIGFLLLVSLSEWSLVLLVVMGGIGLFLISRSLMSAFQIVFLVASFLVAYQFSFYSISRWIYSVNEMSFVHILSDARWPALLMVVVLGSFVTVVLKIEFAVLILSSLLFFSGSLPLSNAVGLIFGEILGWCLLWIYWANSKSRLDRRLFYEIGFLIFLSGTLVLLLLLTLRGYGFLNLRIMGGIEDKKILFLSSWAIFEVLTTILLMIWGHFRYQKIGTDPTDLEPLFYSKNHFKNSGWIIPQTDLRLKKSQDKLNNLQKSKSELTAEELNLIPKPFLKKMLIEVETLKSLIEQLRTHT